MEEGNASSLVTLTILLSSIIAISAMCLIVVVTSDEGEPEGLPRDTWYQCIIDDHAAGDRIYYRVGSSTYYLELVSDDQVCW